MRRLLLPITFIIASCATIELEDNNNTEGMVPFYMEGTVLSGDTPVKHIRVSIESEESTAVVYTSAHGIFRTDGYIRKDRFPFSFTVTLEDIDGEDNGGLFASYTDRIIVFHEDIGRERLIRLTPAYLLTPATASESSLPAL